MKIKIPIVTTAVAVAIFTQTCLARLATPLPEFKSKAEWDENRTNSDTFKNLRTLDISFPFYTGKPFEADKEVYLFKFRNYDSRISRWTSADPSGFFDDPNSYRYTPSPASELDAYGLWSSADYVWHYFFGKSPYQKGATVNLTTTEDLGKVKNISYSHASGPVQFENEIENLMIDHIKNQFTGSDSNTRSRTVNINYESQVFALGNSNLSMAASYAYTGQYNSEGKYKWQYMIDYIYKINDSFVDAVDLLDWFPGEIDVPGSQTFGIVGEWTTHVRE